MHQTPTGPAVPPDPVYRKRVGRRRATDEKADRTAAVNAGSRRIAFYRGSVGQGGQLPIGCAGLGVFCLDDIGLRPAQRGA